jgi:hypothetical protein
MLKLGKCWNRPRYSDRGAKKRASPGGVSERTGPWQGEFILQDPGS